MTDNMNNMDRSSTPDNTNITEDVTNVDITNSNEGATSMEDTNTTGETNGADSSLDNQATDDIPTELHDFTENKVASFVRLSDKYNDIKSSAFTMIFVGVLGMIFMILVEMSIIPLPLNPETSWLFKSVLGGVFIIFIIAGIVSFMHAKQVKIDADEEDKLIHKMLDWADAKLSTAALDDGLDMTQPNELLYFGRADKIKALLMHEFENADEALIYDLTEQIYQKLYED